MPVEAHPLIEGDTVRDLIGKCELRALSIEECNMRFEKMRGD